MSFVSALLLEGGCRLYAAHLARQWDGLKRQESHYFQASADPTLAYELKRDTTLHVKGRHLRINRHGIREAGEETSLPHPIALLGDSITSAPAFRSDKPSLKFCSASSTPREPK